MNYPETHNPKELAGKTVQYNVNFILIAKPKLPEVNTQFAQSLGVVDGNVDNVTAITASNVISIVDGMSSVVPTNILAMEDLHLFVGYDLYRTYALALRNANLFHYTGAENQGEDYSQMIPGTNIRIVAVRGLNGTNRAFLTSASNLYFGTDLLSDSEEFQIFYSNDYDEVRFRAKWKQGVQFAFPDYVVYFSL